MFIGNEDGDGDGLVDAWRSDDDDDDEHGSDGEMEDDDTSDYFTRGHRNSSKSGNDGGEMEWHGRFQVSLERLPPGVELPVAEAVLFAGRAVRILSKPKGGFKFSGQTSRGTNCSNSLLPSSVLRRLSAGAETNKDTRWSMQPCVERIHVWNHTTETKPQTRKPLISHPWNGQPPQPQEAQKYSSQNPFTTQPSPPTYHPGRGGVGWWVCQLQKRVNPHPSGHNGPPQFS